jgi:hypothetical protein
MMLNTHSGSTWTGAGFAPSAAHQARNDRPASPSSSAMRRTVGTTSAVAIAAAVAPSMNSSLAPESLTIAAKSCGVEDGASGATATPARNAPRKVATYSIEL